MWRGALGGLTMWPVDTSVDRRRSCRASAQPWNKVAWVAAAVSADEVVAIEFRRVTRDDVSA